MEEIRVKKVKPLFNYLLVTSNRYTQEEAKTSAGLIQQAIVGQLKPYQTVVFASDIAEREGLTPGKVVAINISRYGVPRQKKNSLKETYDEYYNAEVDYNVPAIDVDGQELLKLGTNDIDFIIEEFAIGKEKSKSNLYVPPKDKVVVL